MGSILLLLKLLIVDICFTSCYDIVIRHKTKEVMSKRDVLASTGTKTLVFHLLIKQLTITNCCPYPL